MLTRALALLLLLAVFCQLSLAQAEPGHPPTEAKLKGALWLVGAMDKADVVTKATPQGLFVMGHGTLMRLDPATLEEKGRLELFGPKIPWSDTAMANFDQGVAFMLERLRRMYYPNMLLEGDDLLVVMGEYYFRVNIATMQLRAAAVICDPDPLGELARLVRPESGVQSKYDPKYLFAPALLEVPATAGDQ